MTVNVRDADTLIGDVTMTFGDEDVFLIPPASIINCEGAQAGPWSPPAPTPDDLVRTFRHTYSQAGDLSIVADAASPELLNVTCPPNPYASQATASRPVRVTEG